MRVYVPYSYASAPRASMLIGWLGHKRRKFGLPVAHTVLPVCWGGREAKEVNGAERQACSSPRWQPLRRQSKLCFLESSLLINILLLQNFKLVFFKCVEYLNTLKACLYFLLVPILLVPCLLRPSCQTARPLSSLVRLLAHPVGRWMCSHSVRLLEWKWTTLCNFFVIHLCLCTWQCQCPGRPETEARSLSILFVRQSFADLTLTELVSLVWISVRLRVAPFFVFHGLNYRNTVLSAWHFDFYMRVKLGSPHLHGKVFTNGVVSVLITS